MGLSVTKLLLILVIVFVIFGAGKLPKVMGDIGKGIKALKDGLKEEDGLKEGEEKQPEAPKIIAKQDENNPKS